MRRQRRSPAMLLILLCILAAIALYLANEGVVSAPSSQAQKVTQHQVVRISRLDCSQYDSPQQCAKWNPSACSAIAMTEIANYYGQHRRVIDILVYEASFGGITPQKGMMWDAVIPTTLAHFGLHGQLSHTLSYDQLVAATADDPLIVGFPPYVGGKYTGGHLLVVTGGNGQGVSLVDSSDWNTTWMSRATFLHYWAQHYTVIVTPA